MPDALDEALIRLEEKGRTAVLVAWDGQDNGIVAVAMKWVSTNWSPGSFRKARSIKIRKLQERYGQHVAMVGDGINDAPALKQANVRLRDDLYEVAIQEDLMTVSGKELFYAYMVDNQAIVIPETIDAIRTLTGTERDARTSIEKTNASLGIEAPVFRT